MSIAREFWMEWMLGSLRLLLLPGVASAQDEVRSNLLPNAASASVSVPNYQPIQVSERANWVVTSTVGPTSLLLAGPLSSAIGTARDIPSEYGTHWDGFAKRNGMRLTGIAAGNLIAEY